MRGAFDRRSLLLGSLVGALALACDEQRGRGGADAGVPSAKTEASSDSFVPVLVAIAERLLPSDDLGPGAREADVGGFFRRVFQDERLAMVHPLLKRGCAFLMKAARAEQQQAFTELPPDLQDELLRRLAENQMRPDGFSGPTFVRVALALTLEAFLGDPRHGGNKDRVGWRFVGFSPDGRAQGLALKVGP